MKQPQYTYAPRGILWAVLKWEYTERGSIGTVLCYFQNKEDAKRLAYTMNY